MDGTRTSSGKSQRPRNQRDRRKLQVSQVESPSSVGNSDGSDPQPQRGNRRQRNDAVNPAPKSATQPITSTTSEKKETTEKENVTVDFSNLKRETEEIAKLTKKFTKREITSNWHRYSPPESAENNEKTEEEAPADFSALIQMPASRGGHLQLKDEQEWSSASGDELGGYFALNLKLLCQSLTCIPIYEQLRLPKHLFTEAELKNFDDMADQAKSSFNPSKIQDSNKKVLQNADVVKYTKMIKETSPLTDNSNISDVKGNTNKLFKLEIDPENILNNCNKKDTSASKVDGAALGITVIEDITSVQPYCKNSGENGIPALETNFEENISNINKQKVDDIFENGNTKFVKENSSSFATIKVKSPDKQIYSLPQTAENTFMDNVDRFVESPMIPNVNVGTIKANTLKEHTTGKETQIDIITTENTAKNEPNVKHPKSTRKSPAKEDNENKSQMKASSINIDDDDDLDFLLSLKTPVLPQPKKESKTTPLKESFTLPGGGKPVESTSKQQNSELDDWLDSVLQN